MKSSGCTGSADGGSKRGKKGGKIESALEVSAAKLEDLKTENAKLSGEIEKLRPKLTAEVRSVEVLKGTNRQLLSKHADEIRVLNEKLADKAREYSELDQKLQLQSTVAVTHADGETHLEDLRQLQAKLSDHEELVASFAKLKLELETIRAKNDETAENLADGELENLRKELSSKTEARQSLDLTVVELGEKILRLAEQNRLQLAEASSLNSSEASLRQLKQEFFNAIVALCQEIQHANAKLTRVALEADNKILILEQKCARLENSIKVQFPAGLLASMKLRHQKATAAISHLEGELSADAEQNPTTNDTAFKSIVAILTNGLDAADPQAYFDAQKDGLKTHLNALRGIKSVMNTALNAILTVLAVCSVVGIPALYFTGTWQKNAEKNGSVFAFSMFGAEQKAKCNIYEATQALGVTLGA